jgi:5-methylcytosine-specific restriction endonuclease McrA
MLDLKRIYWTRQTLRLVMFGVTAWLLVSAYQALAANASKAAAGPAPITATEIFRNILDIILAAASLPGLVIVALTVTAAVIRSRDVRRRDPVRRFSRQQRSEGMARAAGQCEMEVAFRRRCSLPAEHGDHFYPWSKGGSTSLQNFVAACSRCNRAKGARIPSPAQQERLERRRRAYVTLDDAVAVGERQPLP